MNGIRNFADPATVILSTLVALAFLGAWGFAEETAGIDYYVAWVAADAVKNDTEHNIYERPSWVRLAGEYKRKAASLEDAPRQKKLGENRSMLFMSASPFLYWTIGLIATGDYETDLTVWHTLALVLVVFSVLLTCRLLGYPAATSLALLLPILVWFEPMHSDLRVANVNSFQLGLLGLIAWLLTRDRDAWFLLGAGLVAGLTVMFKPNLAPVALLLAGGWLVRWQLQRLGIALLGMAAGAAAAILVSSWWLGNAGSWLGWLKVLGARVERGYGESGSDLVSISESAGEMGEVGQSLLAMSLCLLILAFLWWGRRGGDTGGADLSGATRERIENIQLIALGCLVHLLASKLVWEHYYLLTVPMLIVAFRPWRNLDGRNIFSVLMHRILPGVALVCLMAGPIAGYLKLDPDTFWVVVNGTGVALLLIVGLWQLKFQDWKEHST